ncbi:HET-domain-containing protein [Cucurbitaria berberidis CBS 394.84]|uniref:HET-domain-containing protein n=1 Tax=Cucurbitaria berberidis CBS 394.84 TaxID=1168544 RepID=A0A9P4GF02_9PLEO|nr:HET-domain-containing protein [Cucurbitaria berberidis CBS 394.84]KAF1844818.1 HET-domain-containing protein [Cucurbitaria berberidis CBS 394.84]
MSNPAKPICEGVEDYLRKKQDQPNTPWANPTGSLVKSSECGCRYCYAACNAVEFNDEVEKNRKKNLDASLANSVLDFQSSTNSRKITYGGDNLSVEFRSSGLNFGQHSGLYFDHQGSSSELFVKKRDDDPIIPVSTPISGYTGSEESFEAVIKWFKECIKTHHTLCPTMATPSRLPLRVLDVSIPGTQDVRLLQNNNENGYYASLSHCWGSEKPLQTTLNPNTLTSHLQGIQWEALPKTFQEAVIVTRMFGIQYLWIDSLCIIQDDTADWEDQAAQMADIYQNSVITFAGSASSGPRQGLFRNADPKHIDHGLSGTAMPEGLDVIRKRKPLPHKAADLPLLRRGWVFQERLLSPRYLHFGEHELIWECMEGMSCECGALGNEYSSRSSWLKPKTGFHQSSLKFLNSRAHAVAGVWQSAVEDYSRMILSHPGDIFPAIAGIAKSVKDATGWEYIAGLWKENLITHLVWTVEAPNRVRRCEEWRAPTFSWASIIPKEQGRSGISYYLMTVLEKGLKTDLEERKQQDSRTDIYATVVETSCEPTGDNLSRKLLSGYIVLSGTLIEATLDCSATQGSWKIAPNGRTPLNSSMLYKDYDFNQDKPRLNHRDTVYCLKLIGLSKIPAHVNGEYLLYLVLRKINRTCEASHSVEVDSEFERIGILRDARGEGERRLEELSEECAILRNALVKIT